MKKKEVNEMLYTGMMPPVKPKIEQAILTFLYEHEDDLEAYSLEQGLHEINLRITLRPKEMISLDPPNIEDFL